MSDILSSFWSSYARKPLFWMSVGIIIILGSILVSTGSLLVFISLESMLIVVGGVMVVVFMSFPTEDARRALSAINALFHSDGDDTDTLHDDMNDIIRWAKLLQESGMRSLEKNANNDILDDSFVRYGMNMVVSGYTPPEIRQMMETAADSSYERASVPVDVLDTMSSHAPAFGMIGTLIGMVSMLYTLKENTTMAMMGASLAVAFLTTLYGILCARMVFMPAATRLRQKMEQIRFRHQLIVEGMVLLAAGKTPMAIQDRLNSFLRPESRDYYNIFAPKAVKESYR